MRQSPVITGQFQEFVLAEIAFEQQRIAELAGLKSFAHLDDGGFENGVRVRCPIAPPPFSPPRWLPPHPPPPRTTVSLQKRDLPISRAVIRATPSWPTT